MEVGSSFFANTVTDPLTSATATPARASNLVGIMTTRPIRAPPRSGGSSGVPQWTHVGSGLAAVTPHARHHGTGRSGAAATVAVVARTFGEGEDGPDTMVPFQIQDERQRRAVMSVGRSQTITRFHRHRLLRPDR